MVCQEFSPHSKLDQQNPISCMIVNPNCMPIQPQSVVINWISASRSHVVTHHQVKQEDMKDTARDKYLFAFYNVAMFEPMIQHLSPLL